MVTLGPDELEPQWKGQGRSTFVEGRQDDEFANEPIEGNQKIFTELKHEEFQNIPEYLKFISSYCY